VIEMGSDPVSEYIEFLKRSEFEGYIEGNRDREINYMVFHAYRFREVLGAIPASDDGLRLLDIGTTPFTLLIKRMYPHYEVWTVDRTPLMERRCEEGGVFFKLADLNDINLPFDDSYFDVVIFTEVLEHLCVPPSLVLREVKRVLRPGGMLILSVPNIAALHKRIKLLFGRSVLPPADRQLDRNKIHGYGHLHEYTMGEIEGILRGVGFRILKKKYLQPSVLEAWRASRYLGGGFKSGAGMILSTLFGRLLPSLRPTIYVECNNPG